MSTPRTTLHAQVADGIREQILGGELPVGASLPSEARLCARYDASRGTVRAALAALRHEGLVEGGQGRPSVVRNNATPQSFDVFMSFTARARQSGHEPGQRTIEIARRGCGPVAAQALGLDVGDPVVEVVRLRTLDAEPTMLERFTFVEWLGRKLFDFDADSGSIYAYFASQGVSPHRAQHTVDAVAAEESDAEHLDVRIGAPLLRERRRVLSADGEPLEYAEERFRPDRVTFSIDNVRPQVTGASADLRVVKEIS